MTRSHLLRPLSVFITLSLFSTGCFNSAKRRTVAPPLPPLESFQPLPAPKNYPGKDGKDAKADATWNEAPKSVKQKGADLPALPTAVNTENKDRPIREVEPADMPPLKLPGGPTGALPEAKPIARASSVEIAAPMTPGERVAKAATRIKEMKSMEARLVMRDMRDGKLQPVEEMRFQYRGNKPALHLTWTGETGKGREIVYSEGKHEGKLHILTARGDIFPFSPPSNFSFAPDDPAITSRCKLDIRKSGPGDIIKPLEDLLAKGANDKIKDRGPAKRGDHSSPLHLIEETVSPGDMTMPHGGRRQYYFDTSEGPGRDLPAVLVLIDAGGRGGTSLTFDKFRFNHLTDADFDPKRMGN